MNNYEKLDYLVEKYNLMLEKKTREEYAVDKFKKRYKFEPDEPGSKTGTITVNGEKHRVDIDHNKYLMGKETIDPVTGKGVEYAQIPRYTSTDLTSGKITLGKEYFSRVKNQKRRDAVLNHEIGHKKLHSKRHRISLKPSELQKTRKAAKGRKVTDTTSDDIPVNNYEIEADAYSAAASGVKNIKKGLADVSRRRTLKKTTSISDIGSKIIHDKKMGADKPNPKYNQIKQKREKNIGDDPDFNEKHKKIMDGIKIRNAALKNKDVMNIDSINRNVNALKKRGSMTNVKK